MIPYLALAGTVVVFAALGHALNRRFDIVARNASQVASFRNWTFYDLLAAGGLVAFSGLRYYVGTDYPVYALVYERLGDNWAIEIAEASQEVGFVALMLGTKALTDDPQAIFWVVAFFTVVPVYATIKRKSLNPGLAIAMYVALAYAPSFNAMRQYLAGAIVILAWSYLGSQNRRFVVLATVAISIHLTAAIAVIIIVVARRWRPSPASVALVMLGALALAAVIDQIPGLAQVLAEVNPRYGNYLYSGNTGIGAYLQITAYLALLVFSFIISRHRSPLSIEQKQLAAYILIGVAFMIVGTQAVVLFRLGSYLTIFAVILVPNRVAVARDRVLVSAMLLLALTAYFVLHIANYGDVVPYRTYSPI